MAKTQLRLILFLIVSSSSHLYADCADITAIVGIQGASSNPPRDRWAAYRKPEAKKPEPLAVTPIHRAPDTVEISLDARVAISLKYLGFDPTKRRPSKKKIEERLRAAIADYRQERSSKNAGDRDDALDHLEPINRAIDNLREAGLSDITDYVTR